MATAPRGLRNYGIDAHAHRAALAVSQCNGPAAIAVLPEALTGPTRQETRTWAAAIRANGLTLSELPSGTASTRYRFLQQKSHDAV